MKLLILIPLFLFSACGDESTISTQPSGNPTINGMNLLVVQVILPEEIVALVKKIQRMRMMKSL